MNRSLLSDATEFHQKTEFKLPVFFSTKYFSDERNFSKTLINTKRIFTPNSFVLIDKKKISVEMKFFIENKIC